MGVSSKSKGKLESLKIKLLEPKPEFSLSALRTPGCVSFWLHRPSGSQPGAVAPFSTPPAPTDIWKWCGDSFDCQNLVGAFSRLAPEILCAL